MHLYPFTEKESGLQILLVKDIFAQEAGIAFVFEHVYLFGGDSSMRKSFVKGKGWSTNANVYKLPYIKYQSVGYFSYKTYIL